MTLPIQFRLFSRSLLDVIETYRKDVDYARIRLICTLAVRKRGRELARQGWGNAPGAPLNPASSPFLGFGYLKCVYKIRITIVEFEITRLLLSVFRFLLLRVDKVL